MAHATVSGLSKSEILALRGLRLPGPALKRLRQTGIYCEPAISIEHQQLARQYVIRGVESGGAVKQIGAYVGYVGVDGEPISWLQQVESVGRNGIHAVVIAPEMVRVQMFRSEHTCELLITEHRLRAVEGKGRPSLDNRILFYGIHGTLLNGAVAPAFQTRSGEPLLVPEKFDQAANRVAAAASCLGCRHTHLLGRWNPESKE